MGTRTHCVSKNVPHLLCYNFDIYVNTFSYFFGRNVTHKVSNQKTLYCASALLAKTGKHENRFFFTQMLYQCIATIQLVAPWFLQSFWLRTYAAVWLPKSCNQCVQLGAVGGAWFRKSTAPQQLDCVTRTMHVHQRAVFLKEKKCHLWCVW